jgi:hypothetical protein
VEHGLLIFIMHFVHFYFIEMEALIEPGFALLDRIQYQASSIRFYNSRISGFKIQPTKQDKQNPSMYLVDIYHAANHPGRLKIAYTTVIR